MGKPTSIQLLWEYFNKGYRIKYRDSRTKDEVDTIEKILNGNPEMENTVICFGDPFGDKKYVPNIKMNNSISNLVDMTRT